MPMRKADYHPMWDLISFIIRHERAKNCCEQCGVRNGKLIHRTPGNEAFTYAHRCTQLRFTVLTLRKGWKQADANKYLKVSMVVLTVSHTDRDRHNNRQSNLRALCQRCHIVHDNAQHVRNRKFGRYHDREPQLALFT